ncbi:MAG: hypothetical protein AB7S48_03580 [Bacteroidales bacterium]
MKIITPICLTIILLSSCQGEVKKYGKSYQQNGDIESLEKALSLIEIGCDTSYIKQILGEPIDFGFDYRYLTDSIGENGCSVGAVFGIDSCGKISSKYILEICE